MDEAFLTLEEVFLRIVEKLPHAAETELTHLKNSIQHHFDSIPSANVKVPESEGTENAPTNNPPVD